MATHRIGKIFVEIDLDPNRFYKSQKNILNEIKNGAKVFEKNYRNLGIKSGAAYDLMRAQAEASFKAIKKSGRATIDDMVRAERAKATKIQQINEQQYGKQISMMHKFKKNYLAISASIAASLYVLQRATRPFVVAFEKGFNAVEDYAQSVAGLAAMVVTFTERSKGVSLSDQWELGLKYSTAMVPILENLAAKTLLSGKETTALANAFARAGVFLNASNEKQVESFTRISNALPLMTAGQEIMKQINSEIRAVMTGANAATSMMLQTLRAIDPELDKNLKTWRAEGTVLEHIGDLLVGFGPATELLEKQWQAVKSTIETTATQILRGLMKPAYESIIESTIELNNWLLKNKETITNWGISFRITLISVEAEVLRLAMLLDKFGGTFTSAQMLLYGPGSALGFKSSVKRFEAAAKANMEYAARYAENDKRLEELARNQIALEQELADGSVSAAQQKADASTEFTAKIVKDLDAQKRAMKEAAEQAKALVTAIKELAWGLANLPDEDPSGLFAFINQEDLYFDIELGPGFADAKKVLAAVAKEVKKTTDYFKELDDLMKQAGDSFSGNTFANTMADDIGKVVISMQELMEMYEEQAEIQKELAEARKEAYKINDIDKRTKALEKIGDIEETMMKSQLSGYRQLFGATAQMFEENSSARQAMHTAEMVFAAAEIAIGLKKALVNAVAATTAQGSIPIAGFAMVAAMAVMMGAILAQIGGSFSGGSGSAPSVAQLPQSTVLGADPGTASESISNAFEMLEDVNADQYAALLDIYHAIQDLNQNITGLVTAIVKGSGSVGGGYGAISSPEMEWNAQIENKWEEFSNAFAKFLSLDPIVSMLMKFTGGLLASLLGKIFGGGGWQVLEAAGIELRNIDFGKILQGMEITAVAFARLFKHTEGGLVHSDKDERWTEYAELDQDVIRLLTDIFKNIGEAMVALSKGLGTDVQAVYDYIIPKMQINLNGLNAEQIDKAMQAFFANLTDTMAEDLFGPIIKQYQQVDEGLYETAVRLVMQKEIFLSVLDMTGKAFEGTAEEAIAMSQAVIEAAGGFEKFAESIESYYDAFFTEAEQLAFLGSSLSESFMELDLVMPGTKQGFRDLIEGIDLTTESGQDLYAALLSIAGASGEYYDALEDAAKQLADAEKSLHETQMESIVRGVVDDFNDIYEALGMLYGLGSTTASGMQVEIANKIEANQLQQAALLASEVAKASSFEALLTVLENENLLIQSRIVGAKAYFEGYLSDMIITGDVEGQADITQVLADLEQGTLSSALTWLNAEIARLQAGGDSAEAIAALASALLDLEAAAIRLAEFEKRQLVAIKVDMGLQDEVVFEQFRFDEIAARYEGSFEDTIDWFANATLDDIKAIADTLGINWLEIATDVGFLVGYFDDLQATIKKITENQWELLGTTEEERIKEIENRYARITGPEPPDSRMPVLIPTLEGIISFIDHLSTMRPEKVIALAEHYEVTIDQLFEDLFFLKDAFEIAEESVEDFAEKIKDIFAQIRENIEISQWTQARPNATTADYWFSQIGDMQARILPGAEDPLVKGDLVTMSELVTKWYDAAIQVAQTWEQVADSIEGLISQVDSLVNSIKYSTLNVGLPAQKFTEAEQDYATLKAAAETGGQAEIQEYLSFVQTYLQQAQDEFKSSEAYQQIYTDVMADLETVKGDLEAGGYDQKIYDELTTIDATLQARLTEINETFLGFEDWINAALEDFEGFGTWIVQFEGIDQTNFDDVMGFLADVVDGTSWESAITLYFLGEIDWDSYDVEDVQRQLNDIIEGAGWNSTAMVTIVSNINWAAWTAAEIEAWLTALQENIDEEMWTSAAFIHMIADINWDQIDPTAVSILLQNMVDAVGWDADATVLLIARISWDQIDPALVLQYLQQMITDLGTWDAIAITTLIANVNWGSWSAAEIEALLLLLQDTVNGEDWNATSIVTLFASINWDIIDPIAIQALLQQMITDLGTWDAPAIVALAASVSWETWTPKQILDLFDALAALDEGIDWTSPAMIYLVADIHWRDWTEQQVEDLLAGLQDTVTGEEWNSTAIIDLLSSIDWRDPFDFSIVLSTLKAAVLAVGWDSDAAIALTANIDWANLAGYDYQALIDEIILGIEGEDWNTTAVINLMGRIDWGTMPETAVLKLITDLNNDPIWQTSAAKLVFAGSLDFGEWEDPANIVAALDALFEGVEFDSTFFADLTLQLADNPDITWKELADGLALKYPQEDIELYLKTMYTNDTGSITFNTWDEFEDAWTAMGMATETNTKALKTVYDNSLNGEADLQLWSKFLIAWNVEGVPKETVEKVLESAYIAAAETGLTTWTGFKAEMLDANIGVDSTAWKTIEAEYNNSKPAMFTDWEAFKIALNEAGVSTPDGGLIKAIEAEYNSTDGISWSELEGLLDATGDPSAVIRSIEASIIGTVPLVLTEQDVWRTQVGLLIGILQNTALMAEALTGGYAQTLATVESYWDLPSVLNEYIKEGVSPYAVSDKNRSGQVWEEYPAGQYAPDIRGFSYTYGDMAQLLNVEVVEIRDFSYTDGALNVSAADVVEALTGPGSVESYLQVTNNYLYEIRSLLNSIKSFASLSSNNLLMIHHYSSYLANISALLGGPGLVDPDLQPIPGAPYIAGTDFPRDEEGDIIAGPYEVPKMIDYLAQIVENTGLTVMALAHGDAHELSNIIAAYQDFILLNGWPDLPSQLPQFAEGGVASGPTSGYPVELHGTEVVSTIPQFSQLINGGSTQVGASDRPIDISLTVEIEGKPLDIKIKNISSREADRVRVTANKRPGNETRRLYR